jgi:single-strand DNA-binding protein
MSRAINQVILMGNLTRDPELRQSSSGQAVTSFSVALNRNYKDASGEFREATDYIDCVCFGNLAETIANLLKKGSRVVIEGRLQTRKYDKDGVSVTKVEVLAKDVTFV